MGFIPLDLKEALSNGKKKVLTSQFLKLRNCPVAKPAKHPALSCQFSIKLSGKNNENFSNLFRKIVILLENISLF